MKTYIKVTFIFLLKSRHKHTTSNSRNIQVEIALISNSKTYFLLISHLAIYTFILSICKPSWKGTIYQSHEGAAKVLNISVDSVK